MRLTNEHPHTHSLVAYRVPPWPGADLGELSRIWTWVLQPLAFHDPDSAKKILRVIHIPAGPTNPIRHFGAGDRF